MQQLTNFIAMGGYGTYIWLAYGASLVLLLICLIAPLRKKRKIIRDLKCIVFGKDD